MDGSVRQVQVSFADKLTLNLKLKASGPTGYFSPLLPQDETAIGNIPPAEAEQMYYAVLDTRDGRIALL